MLDFVEIESGAWKKEIFV